MIDLEDEISEIVVAKLRSRFNPITIYGEETLNPPSFPCVTLVEGDNYTVTKTQDSGSGENHATVMYEVNVFSNKANTKKAECKEIFAVIDDIFISLGFARLNKNPLAMNQTTVYRIVARYSATVSKDNKIYRRN